jgi:hypothetical protein
MAPKIRASGQPTSVYAVSELSSRPMRGEGQFAKAKRELSGAERSDGTVLKTTSARWKCCAEEAVQSGSRSRPWLA